MKILNKYYREFLSGGFLKSLSNEDIKIALDSIKGYNRLESRSLLIALYVTGARPNEVLNLKAGDIQKENNYIIFELKGSKGGNSRRVYFSIKKYPFLLELLKYSKSLMIGINLFYHFRQPYLRTYKLKNGEVKQRLEYGATLRYHFNKWFSFMGGLPPYYLRHNRFSAMARAGATEWQIKHVKGSKTTESIQNYIHVSKDSAKKAARYS
jgi:integrase